MKITNTKKILNENFLIYGSSLYDILLDAMDRIHKYTLFKAHLVLKKKSVPKQSGLSDTPMQQHINFFNHKVKLSENALIELGFLHHNNAMASGQLVSP